MDRTLFISNRILFFSIEETLEERYYLIFAVAQTLEKKKKSHVWESNPRPPLSILKKGVLYTSESVKQSMHRGNGKVWFRLPETLFIFAVTPSGHGLSIVFSNHDIESSICVKIFRSIGIMTCPNVPLSVSSHIYLIFKIKRHKMASI